MVLTFWVSIVLFINGIVSFAYSVNAAKEPATLWGMLAVNFVFFMGVTQTGVVFSALMRLTKSGWGRYYTRVGEILTLAYIPVAVVTFLIIYFLGTGHIFYWAGHGETHGQISPWVGRGLFFWRNAVSNVLFYIAAFLYFSSGRDEAAGARSSGSRARRRNILAGVVCFFYVIANTFVAWDFGMMIIPHWESSIFPPYFWCGNLLAGAAFLFVVSLVILPRADGEGVGKGLLEPMGKVLIGFVLLWIYMFWSQHIVLWYGNLPNFSEPVFRQMRGEYAPAFAIMLVTVFIFPFLMLLFRRIKLTVKGLAVISVSVCVGVWFNRYLMIIPVLADHGPPVLATWTGISLILGALSSAILPLSLLSRVSSGEKALMDWYRSRRYEEDI
jgi:hypothetical protein